MNQISEFSELEKYFQEHPDSLVFAHIAKHYMEQGNFERAIEIASQGVDKFPHYAFGNYILGMCYYYLKDYPKAKTYLEMAVAYDEKLPRAWKILAEVNEKLDLPIQAEEARLKYFLLDSFNEDAVKMWESGEAIRLEELVPPATESQESVEIEEKEIGEFIEESETVEEEFESVDLDALLDSLPEEPEAGRAEQSPTEDQAVREDQEAVGIEAETPAEEEKAAETADRKEQEQLEEISEEQFSDAIDEFFAEWEEKKDTDTLEPFSEPEDQEPPVLEPASELELEEPNLLDFGSVVDDIIEERKQEIFKIEQETEESRTRVTITHEEEPETKEIPDQTSTKEGTEDYIPPQPEHPASPPILSPTLGEIYLAQGRFQEAREVFKQLLEKDPDNERFKKKILHIEMLIQKQKDMSR